MFKATEVQGMGAFRTLGKLNSCNGDPGLAGTHMYLVHKTGAFNEIHIVQMLQQGLHTEDWAGATGFATGFLLARILECPLVGIQDIGGSLLTDVGIGILAMLMTVGVECPMYSFPVSLGLGLVIGLVIEYDLGGLV